MKQLFTTLLLVLGFSQWAQAQASVSFSYGTNTGIPASPPSPFETCTGLNARFTFQNFPTAFNYFDIPLKDGTYRRFAIAGSPNTAAAPNGNTTVSVVPSGSCTPLPSNAPFCGRIDFVVPTSGGGAVTGPVRFYNVSNNLLATITLVVQNPAVSMGALDPSICSQDTIPLIASPSGGSFNLTPIPAVFAPTPTVSDYIQNPPASTPWNLYQKIFVPNPSGPNNVITGNHSRENILITYTYTPRLSDGTACPNNISAFQGTWVYANYPFHVNYQSMPIARTWIENLLTPSPNGVVSAELGGLEYPNWVDRNQPDIDFIFSGTYVDSGYYFMGDVLGSGNSSTITLDINNRGCWSRSSTVVMVQNPSTAIPAQYCQGTKDTFSRSDIVNGPSYFSIGGLEFDHLEITCSPYSGAMTLYNGSPGNESYIFNTASIPGGTTITITFQYYTRIFGSRFDGTTLTFTTTILGTSGFTPPPSFPVNNTFCHNAGPQNLSAFTPNPDTIRIKALTGSQAGNIVTVLTSSNSFTFLPAAIHTDSLIDTDYRLIFKGGPCGTVDSFTFRITGKIQPFFVGRHGSNFTYCRNEAIDVLQPFPLPSTGYSAYFSGHAAVDSLGIFNVSNTGNGVVTFPITYNFTSIYGCFTSFTDTFVVNPVPTISLTTSDANNQFCANDTIGYLFGIPSGGTYSGPTIQSASDTSFLPNLIYIAGGFINTVGYADFFYMYQDSVTGCRDTTDVRVYINPIPQPNFSIDPYFCESHPNIQLFGSPNISNPTQNFFYSSNLDTNIVHAGYYYPNRFYPNTLLLAPRIDTIIYQVADSTPCIGRDTQIVTIFPNPVISFVGVNSSGDTTNQACLGQDTLRLTPGIFNPAYFSPPGTFSYAGPGILFGTDRFVADVAGVGPHVLTAYFYDTIAVASSSLICRDTFVDTFYVHSTPKVEFSVNGGCGDVDMIFVPNNSILGLNRYYFGTTNLYDSITTAIWDFGDNVQIPAVYTIGPIANIIDTAIHFYAQPGVYNASLFVENRGYCSDSDTIRVLVLPTSTPLDTLPYTQDFEADNGGWLEEAEGSNTSSNLWNWGITIGPRIRTNNDPNHLHVWTTNLNGPYPQNASGWVYSPCVDLTQLDRPMLKFDFKNDTDPGNDGVVIEYYDNTQQRWLPLGDVNRGLEWYNYSVIAGRPGLQDLAPRGWSGVSSTWKDARYKLDDFKSYTDFRFRVAFGAVGVSSAGYEGFAFDNVWIGNRSRNVLLEHFSNSGLPNFDGINNHVYNLVYSPGLVRDVIMVQYNTNFPGSDHFNGLNAADPSGRAEGNYSLQESGKGLVDGRDFNTAAANSIDLNAQSFEYEMLESPKFDIELTNVSIFNGNIQATVKVTANEAMPLDNYNVHILVVEDSLYYPGIGNRIHSFVRKMLPNAAGTNFQRSWNLGDTVVVTESWPYDISDWNTNNLSIVSFIEKDQPNLIDIFQAASTRDITAYTVASTQTQEEVVAAAQEVLSAKLYPNPATESINIEFDKALGKDYQWEVFDLLGQQLRQGQIQAGENRLTIHDLGNWPAGAYLFIIRDPQFKMQRKFILKGK